MDTKQFSVKKDTQNRQRWLICLALALVTAAVYLPSLRHSFLDYDDQQYVTENPHVTAGLTTAGVHWAFGFHAANWHPLAWLSHMLDCQIFGLKPWGHHLTNVLLHVANTVLLFWVLVEMTNAGKTPNSNIQAGGRPPNPEKLQSSSSKLTIWRSAAVAALFAWHPLHVESVAWVAERKDVLSTLFFLLTLWAYGRYATQKDPMSIGSMLKFEFGEFDVSDARVFYPLTCLFTLGS